MRPGLRSTLPVVVLLACLSPVAGDASTTREFCRRAPDGRAVPDVPRDLVPWAERHFGVVLEDLGSPSVDQLADYRAAVAREADEGDTFRGEGDVVCTVSYADPGGSGAVPALLVHRFRSHDPTPCFGPPGGCGPRDSYYVDCVSFRDALTGSRLTPERCWRFRPAR